MGPDLRTLNGLAFALPACAWGRPGRGRSLASLILATLAILVLSGCVLDKEAAVRAQLADWVLLGETRYFHSTGECTAGVFATGATQITSGVKRVQGVDRGLGLIRQGVAVAFDVTGMAPVDVYRALDSADHSTALGILVSGLAARDCYGQDMQDGFANVLNTAGVVLVFDPENKATALFDRAGKRIFYTRAEL